MVLQLTADDEELVHRLLGRAKETGRSDDNQAVIRHRLHVHHKQTEAVVARYAERDILTQVDGIGTIEEVTDRFLQAVKEPAGSLTTAKIREPVLTIDFRSAYSTGTPFRPFNLLIPTWNFS